MTEWWQQETFSRPDVPLEESARAGEPQISAPSQGGPLAGREWRSMVILTVVAIFVVAVRGFDLWRGQVLASASERYDLRQVISAELAARWSQNEEAYRDLLDPLTPSEWRQQQVAALATVPLPVPGEEPPVIEHWEFQGDTAMVELRFLGPPASRETRFYRLVAGSWRRTAPLEVYWGRKLKAEAPGIRFIYREADAEAVEGVLAAWKTAYRQGTPSVLAGDPLTIEIVPDHVLQYRAAENLLLLPSPRLTPRLVTVPDSALILWRMAHPIADRLADPGDAVRYRYLDSIQLFQDQLRYWPAKWQAPFPNPWETQMIQTLRSAQAANRLSSPRAINLFQANRSTVHLAYYETLTMADYIVERYGSAVLLPLDQALAQTRSWQKAIALVLGTDINEFERGWREYLARRAGF